MVTSIPMKSIPHLTIHQLESFFPLEEHERELIISMCMGGGENKGSKNALLLIQTNIIHEMVKPISIHSILDSIVSTFTFCLMKYGRLAIPYWQIKYTT